MLGRQGRRWLALDLQGTAPAKPCMHRSDVLSKAHTQSPLSLTAEYTHICATQSLLAVAERHRGCVPSQTV